MTIAGMTSGDSISLELDRGGRVVIPRDADFTDTQSALTYDLDGSHPQTAIACIRYTYNDRPVGSVYLCSPGLKGSAVSLTSQDASGASAVSMDQNGETDVPAPLDSSGPWRRFRSPGWAGSTVSRRSSPRADSCPRPCPPPGYHLKGRNRRQHPDSRQHPGHPGDCIFSGCHHCCCGGCEDSCVAGRKKKIYTSDASEGWNAWKTSAFPPPILKSWWPSAASPPLRWEKKEKKAGDGGAKNPFSVELPPGIRYNENC